MHKNWSVERVYNFVHFRSMPDKKAVFWINSPKQINGLLEEMLSDAKNQTVEKAQEWFEKINQYPAHEASKRIVAAMEQIIETSQKKQ